jgi:hypothetical protein
MSDFAFIDNIWHLPNATAIIELFLRRTLVRSAILIITFEVQNYYQLFYHYASKPTPSRLQ